MMLSMKKSFLLPFAFVTLVACTPPSTFDPTTVRVGDRLGTFTVSALGTDGFGTIEFSGSRQFQGKYVDNAAYGDGALHMVCLLQDPALAGDIPYTGDDLKIHVSTTGQGDVAICFDRKDALAKGIPPYTHGTATVTISKYIIDLAHGENATEVGVLTSVDQIHSDGKITIGR